MQQFWGIELTPGKSYSQTLPRDLRITNVALTANSKAAEKTILQCTVDDEKTFTIGSLKLGATEQFTTDLLFNEGSKLVLSLKGPNSLSILGYYDILEDEEESDEEGMDGIDNPLAVDEEGEEEGGSDEEEGSDEEGESEEETKETPKTTPTQAEVKNGKAQNNNQTASDKKRKQDGNQKKEPVEATPTKKPKIQPAQRVEISTPQPGSEKKKAQSTPASTKKKEAAPATPKSASTPLKEPMRKQLPNGLIVEDLVIGNGAPAQVGRKVGVKYIGKLKSGKTFDSSLKHPFSFRLGVGQVIKGWDIGIKGMKVGGKRRLTIPANLAYGSIGAPPDIPPNSTLIFDVELCDA